MTPHFSRYLLLNEGSHRWRDDTISHPSHYTSVAVDIPQQAHKTYTSYMNVLVDGVERGEVNKSIQGRVRSSINDKYGGEARKG